MAALKKRIDLLLVEKGFFPTREQARRALMAGQVFYNQQRVEKCGSLVSTDGHLEIKGTSCSYVSRGGLKLEAILDELGIEVRGKIALDCGSSTGGFTDCLLKHGAVKVFAVDVGYGQLDWNLRQDSRVVVMERTNIRYLKQDEIGEKIDLVTLDLSFISLVKVWDAVKALLKPEGSVIALIKPQFEAGRGKVGKGGIVKKAEIHREVLERVLTSAIYHGFYVKGLTFSPLRGADGNIEFLALLSLEANSCEVLLPEVIADVVERAHKSGSEKG